MRILALITIALFCTACSDKSAFSSKNPDYLAYLATVEESIGESESNKDRLDKLIDNSLANYYGLLGLNPDTKVGLNFSNSAMRFEWDYKPPKNNEYLFKNIFKYESLQIAAHIAEQLQNKEKPIDVPERLKSALEALNLKISADNDCKKMVTNKERYAVNSCFKKLVNADALNIFTVNLFEPHTDNIDKQLLGAALKTVADNRNLSELHKYKVTEWLLDSGANINQDYVYLNSTALIHAIDSSNFTLARYLIENNADVNKPAIGEENSDITSTPLLSLFSINYNNLNEFQVAEYVKLFNSLVNNKANWQQVNKKLNLPTAMYAAKNGHVNAIEYFKRTGGNLTEPHILNPSEEKHVTASITEIAIGSGNQLMANLLTEETKEFDDYNFERAANTYKYLNFIFQDYALDNFSIKSKKIQ